MIYILGWLLSFATLWACRLAPRRAKLLCFFGIIIIGCIPIFRGLVGTDTSNYQVMSSFIRMKGIFGVGVEPVFPALMYFVQLFGFDDMGVVRVMAGLDVALLLVFIWRSTETERYFIFSVFIPAFFYFYTMNELRIGLASIIFLLITQHVFRLRRTGIIDGISLCVMIFTHYSSIFFPVFSIFTIKKWSLWSLKLLVSIAILTIVVIVIASPGYIFTKLDTYDSFHSPSFYSGASSVLQILILSYATWKSLLSKQYQIKLISVAGTLTLIFFILARFSYAGLRLLDLVVFSCAVFLMYMHSIEKKEFNAEVKKSLIVFGIVSTIFVFRNFLDESAHSFSPFLPYHFFF